MVNTPEKIIILDADPHSREDLRATLQSAGYDVSAFATTREGLDAIHQSGADLLLLDAAMQEPGAGEVLATIRGSAKTAAIRVMLLVAGGSEQRASALDLGANDAISRPFDSRELLARVRARLRVQRAENELREKMRIAEEGQQIAHTAFEALAVTEKMTSDAFSLDRKLKTGFAAVLAVAILMAGIYFLFARSAQKVTQRSNSMLARLEGGIVRQQDLIAEARRLRAQQGIQPGAVDPAAKDDLKKQAEDLKAKMATANSDDAASLQKQLQETNSRLQRLEAQGQAAQSIIPMDVQSVCLLHVSVAFNDQTSGRRLRYGGLNEDGEPIQDSEGNPVLTLEGKGPEVKLDVFGTGFIAGPSGRVITNRHVAEPWWKNDEITSITSQGLQPQISAIRAYFPGDPRAFHAEIQDISEVTDLASVRVDLQDLKRPVLALDTGKNSALSGQPVILMGYATGLAAILARTDEESAQDILKKSGSDVAQVLNELAKRNLIHPLITQGHIGDILPDKIVFDAQTTSGGSGGPLFNRDGKVIGVTVAILKGFGGSNFGIPIRFSEPLLSK
ncbi:MAG TPA: trypsin-like peptidase domain-containing protein [Candidatus Acidoferrales bacterium]|nr:trypsin-like peptidase domain-containing protein [Candidatus Acidoferrales bacterium]